MSGPVLHEREAELGLIDAALAVAREGRGGPVLIEGDPGLGKTALLDRARERAQASGMAVLSARCGELEREWAYGAIRQLFELPLARAGAAERAEVLAGAAGVAAGRLGLAGLAAPDPAPAGGGGALTILHGLYWLCANLAARSPLALVVDDAQWIDPPSARALAFVLARLDELPVALLVAARPQEPGAPRELLDGLATERAGAVLRPAPLGEAGTARLLADALGREPDPEFSAACREATGGVPFLLVALARRAADAGVAPDAAAAGRVVGAGAEEVGRWVLTRLRGLPEPAEAVARAVAVLEQASIADAAALAGIAPDAAAGAHRDLAAAGILGAETPLRFAQQLLRASVYARLGEQERFRLHRRAADVLQRAGAPVEQVAEHLLASAPARDPAVVAALRTAADSARQSGSPRAAAAYLERARREPPAPDLAPLVLLELGLAEAASGHPDGPRRLAEAVDAPGPPDARRRAALAGAHVLSRQGRIGEGLALLSRARAAVGDEDGALDRLEVTIASVSPEHAPAIREAAARLRARADRPGADADTSGLAALLAVRRGEPVAVVRELASRDLAGRLATGSPRVAQSLLALVWAEQDDLALPALSAAIDGTRATGDDAVLPIGLAYRALLAFRRGDLGTAEEDARALVSLGSAPAAASFHRMAIEVLVRVLVERELPEEAEDLLQESPLVPPLLQTAAPTLLARAHVHAARGRHEDALADALAAGEVALATDAPGPGWLPWRAQVAAAHTALGQREEARIVAAEEVGLARATGAPRATGIALRAAGLAEPPGAGQQGLLRESVAAHRAGTARLELARSLTDLGAALRRTAEKEEARELLREGLDLARTVGSPALAARAEAELKAAGARPRRAALSGAGSLTPSERRVAELAAEGLTNREIGETLFVTARTAEGHLTKAFRKLGVSRREDLPGALAE